MASNIEGNLAQASYSHTHSDVSYEVCGYCWSVKESRCGATSRALWHDERSRAAAWQEAHACRVLRTVAASARCEWGVGVEEIRGEARTVTTPSAHQFVHAILAACSAGHDDIALEAATASIRRALLAFGSETPDNLACAAHVAFGASVGRNDSPERTIGLRLAGANVMVSDILYEAERAGGRGEPDHLWLRVRRPASASSRAHAD
jgi:hypothetical protein